MRWRCHSTKNESKKSEYLKSGVILAVTCGLFLLSTCSAPSRFIQPPVALLGKKSVLWHTALHMDPPVFSTGLSHTANHFWDRGGGC